MDDNHEAQKTSWGNVARSLIGVLLGGLLVIAGGVVTSTLNRDNAAEARREERAAEAYSAMLSDLTKAAIDLGQWRGALGRGGEAEIEFVRQELRDASSALIASAGMVAVVGTDEAAGLVVETPTFVQRAMAATSPEDVDAHIDAILQAMVLFRAEARTELGLTNGS